MEINMQLPLTEEQEKVLAELERLDMLIGALGAPLPIGVNDIALHRFGEFGCRIEAEAMSRQLLVTRFALSAELSRLEEAKPKVETDFEDNLPLGGEVRVKGETRVHIYLGFEAGNTRRCAVGLKGQPEIAWFDRAVLIPARSDG